MKYSRGVTYDITSNGVLNGGSNDGRGSTGAEGVSQNAVARLDRLSTFGRCHGTRSLGRRCNDAAGDVRGRCNGADGCRQVDDLSDGADSGGFTGRAVGNVLGTADNSVSRGDLNG